MITAKAVLVMIFRHFSFQVNKCWKVYIKCTQTLDITGGYPSINKGLYQGLLSFMTAKNLFLPLNVAKTKFAISRHSIYKCAVLFSALTVLAVSTPVVAAEEISNAPVDLQADSLHHDEINNTVTASGDVIMIQDGRTLKADKIVYNLTTDTAKAVGNVEFTDSNGDRHEAEQVTFNNAMKDGFVEGLKTFLIDGSRFTADEGEHKRGNETVMRDATYTPCDTCENDPEDLPLWQIRASEVTHDKQDKTVSYRKRAF